MSVHPPTSAAADAQRRAELMYATTRVLANATTVEGAVTALLPALADALRWEFAAAWLVTENGKELACVAVWAIPDDPALEEFKTGSLTRRFRPGEGLPGRVWSGAAPVWLRDVIGDPNFPRLALAERARLQGGLAFPVFTSASGVTGVIECFTRRQEGPDIELLHITDTIGLQIGQFLERRWAEEHLDANEARYAAIVTGALDAILMIDEHGCITEFNPAAERLFGYTRAEAIGREMAEVIIPPPFRERHRLSLRRHDKTRASELLGRRIELSALRRDGSEFPVELSISRVEVKNRVLFIGFVRDITERRRHERERDELLARERAAREEAVQANRLKDEFLAALSHELRTPLNAVLGWTKMLMDDAVPPPRQAEVLATIYRNADAERQVVEDLLEVSTFVTGRTRLQVERVALPAVVDGALAALRPAAEAKRIALSVDVPDIRLQGDRLRLQQVLWNLIANAVKFTPAGGAVSIRATTASDAVTITVRDNGRGIDPALVPYVFDRFRQIGAAPGQGGLGLGLSLVRQIVEAHGGTAFAHSDGLDRGAAFTVRLPYHPPASAPANR